MLKTSVRKMDAYPQGVIHGPMFPAGYKKFPVQNSREFALNMLEFRT